MHDGLLFVIVIRSSIQLWDGYVNIALSKLFMIMFVIAVVTHRYIVRRICRTVDRNVASRDRSLASPQKLQYFRDFISGSLKQFFYFNRNSKLIKHPYLTELDIKTIRLIHPWYSFQNVLNNQLYLNFWRSYFLLFNDHYCYMNKKVY